MKIYQIRVSRFRGWKDVLIRPQGHAVIVGEPRAGRSDLIEAISRVLDPESTRGTPSEFDVYIPPPGKSSEPEADQNRLAEVELVLGELGEVLEQHFFRHLELWGLNRQEVIPELTPDEYDSDSHELVLRLCYRIRWDREDGVGEHWVDYPKTSSPADEIFDRVRRPDRLVLPFIKLDVGQPLSLRTGSAFRQLIEVSGPDIGDALLDLAAAVDRATDNLSRLDSISTVLQEIVSVARTRLSISSGERPEDVFLFRAEGGSVAGLMRALQPTLRLDGGEAIPIRRQGSTASAVLATSEAIVAATMAESAVVVCDDFGEGLDAASAEFLARGNPESRRPGLVVDPSC